MKRPVMIHGVLLAAGLCAAYLTWTRDPTGAEDEVQIVSLRGGLDRVIYKSEDRTVEIDRRKDEQGSYHWLRVETWEIPRPPPPPPMPAPAPTPAPGSTGAPDAKAEPKKGEPKKAEPKKAEPRKAEPKKLELKKPELKKLEPKKAEPKKAAAKKDTLDKDPKAEPKKAEPKKAEPKKAEPKKAEPKKAEPKKPEPMPTLAPPPPPKPLPKVKKVQEFKGSKSADELMKGLAAFSAVRSLGAVTEADKLKDFGLEGSKKTLTLVSGSTPRVFVLGGNTFGNMDTYLQDKADGRVYVVRPRLLQDFLYAEFRLVDRMLHAFDQVDVERAIVSVATSGKKELVQQNRRDPAGAFWAEAATPEKRKDFYRNWMAKVMRLSGLEYVPPEKKLDGLKLLVTIEYFGGGKRLGQCRMYKHTTLVPKVAGSTDLGAGDYYASSENSRAMVKLSRPLGEEIERDIANLMKE